MIVQNRKIKQSRLKILKTPQKLVQIKIKEIYRIILLIIQITSQDNSNYSDNNTDNNSENNADNNNDDNNNPRDNSDNNADSGSDSSSVSNPTEALLDNLSYNADVERLNLVAAKTTEEVLKRDPLS